LTVPVRLAEVVKTAVIRVGMKVISVLYFSIVAVVEVGLGRDLVSFVEVESWLGI
jgi:hypothetical protein